MYNTRIQIFENLDLDGVHHIIFDSATYVSNVMEIEKYGRYCEMYISKWNILSTALCVPLYVSILGIVSVCTEYGVVTCTHDGM